jgi:hypothetical protein
MYQGSRGMGSQYRSQGFGAGSQYGTEDEDFYEDQGSSRYGRNQDFENEGSQQGMSNRYESDEDYGGSRTRGRGRSSQMSQYSSDEDEDYGGYGGGSRGGRGMQSGTGRRNR